MVYTDVLQVARHGFVGEAHLLKMLAPKTKLVATKGFTLGFTHKPVPGHHSLRQYCDYSVVVIVSEKLTRR